MMTQTELRRPFGTILDENEQQLALSSDDDEDGAERLQPMRAAPRPSGFRKSLAMQQKRRRRRSSARFLRLAGSKLDEDEDEDDDEDGGPSPAQQDLGEMYKQAIQLNAENKLNSKNSWGLRLIENIDKFLEEDEMVENEVEKRVNFTKASCTLDASVKIYSYRVDDVHLTSYKVLANLNRNDENKKSGKKPTDANHDDGETEEKKSSTNERRGGGVTETLETNLANINLNKLDSAFDIDPLFHKMSKTFDEGGAKGLLLANLGVGQHGCNIVFDSKEAEEEGNGPADDGFDQEDGFIDIASLSAKLESILGGISLENIELVPQLRTLREELRILSKDGFVDNDAPKKSRRYASSHQEEKEAEISIHQEALERSRASQGTLAVTSALGNAGILDHDEDEDVHEFAADDYGGDDDDDMGFTDFIAADVNGGRYSSISFQNEPFVDDSVPGAMGLQTTTSTLLDALCNGDALNGNGYEFFSQATLEKLSQGNDWAGSQHWKKTEHFRRKHVETKDSPKQKRKKASKERVFVDLSVPVCLDDILQPAKKNNRGTDPIQLSKAMITKYTKCHNLLPPDAGIGLKELSTLFMRPNAIVRANVELPDRGGKTVGFHNTVDTFADGSGFDDGESWGGGEDDGQGFTLTEDDNHGDNFVVKELEGVRKVQKTRVGYATVAKIVDVKRLKKDLWTELESTLVPVVEESEIGEETNHTGGDIKPPEEEGHKKLSFNNTVAEMSVSQSQNDVTLPFYFICLLHLANEKGLRLESQGLEDFFICVDDGAEPSVGFLPDIASAPRAARKKGKAAIVESEDEGDSEDSKSDDDN